MLSGLGETEITGQQFYGRFSQGLKFVLQFLFRRGLQKKKIMKE